MARILCIEDNALNMRLVRKILHHAGHTLIEATTGIFGLEAALDELPDLILLDINLPDIDGINIALCLKRFPELSKTPIIAVTANAMYGDRERFLLAGCDGYVAKPIARSELLEAVEQFISSTQDSHSKVHRQGE
jgi:two-component system, cell cycle response regulator DivK